MEKTHRKRCLALTLLVALGLAADHAVAGGSLDRYGNNNGLAIGSDAAGQKVGGVISIEYYNTPRYTDRKGNSDGTYADARIVVKLRSGNILHGFYKEVLDAIPLNAPYTQVLITAAFRSDILNAFSGGDWGQSITLTRADNFVLVDIASDRFYTVGDIEVSVK